MPRSNVACLARVVLLGGASLTVLSCASDRVTRTEDQPSPPDTTSSPTSPVTPPITGGFRLEVLRGEGQWAREFTSVPDSIELMLSDRQRRPLAGRTVRFRVENGGGQVSDSVAVSDAQGRVVVPTWRLGDASLVQSLRASIDTASVVVRGYAFRVPVATPGQDRMIFVSNQKIYEAGSQDLTPRLIRQLPLSFTAQAVSGDLFLASQDKLGRSVCIESLAADSRNCVILPGYGNPGWFAWSPDGTELVFHAQSQELCGGGQFVCSYPFYTTLAIDRRTMAVTPVLAFGKRLEIPRWSRDGAMLAFMQQGALWLMRPDGSGLRQLSLPSNLMVRDMSWSPSGEQIALNVAFSDQCPWLCDTGIAVVSVFGRGLSHLVEAKTEKEEYVSRPVWSPDGSRIAYTFERLAASGLYDPDVFVISSAGGASERILSSAMLLSWR
jgi:Tol biopolymer transport system component